MPYIEGPKMDWTVSDDLYHRFLTWHLKCDNILEYELAMLPEKRQCKKVMHGPVCFLKLVHGWINGWYHLGEILRILQAPIKWSKGQIWLAYKLPARKQVSWWMVQCSKDPGYLAKYPQKWPRSFTGTSFGFFLKDEEFVSKTINDSNIDLDKFPSSKVRQLAKKMESPKVTTRHIK